jgi:response regulator RpfG family c-di-GMP phosphodiesterase
VVNKNSGKNMSDQAPFYIVEDDNYHLGQLENIIHKAFSSAEVKTYEDAFSAWKDIALVDRPIIVISNYKMPKMNGMDLLHKIRDNNSIKESYIILMTNSHSRDDNLKILKEGADDFLDKPFEIDRLIAKLRNASKLTNIKFEHQDTDKKIKELSEQLEAETLNQKYLIQKFTSIRLPELSANINEINDGAIWIAKHLSEDLKEIKDIGHAADLAYCGKAVLPEKSIDKPVMISGRIQNDDMKSLPLHYEELTKNIRNFERVTEALKHIYENYDGTGMPNGIKSWNIPLGSRILRVMLDYYEILKKNKDNAGKTMDAMFHESKRLYDFRVIAYLDQYFASRGKASKVGFSGKEVPYMIRELETGMMVSRNVITDSAMILISAGSVLNDEKIERIRTIAKSDPIIGKIYIKEK